VAVSQRKYDLYSDAFRANPYATFAAMRAEDPVFRQPGLDGETPIWFVTHYEEVAAILLDGTRRSSVTRGRSSGR
jgi:cytochrome P450